MGGAQEVRRSHGKFPTYPPPLQHKMDEQQTEAQGGVRPDARGARREHRDPRRLGRSQHFCHGGADLEVLQLCSVSFCRRVRGHFDFSFQRVHVFPLRLLLQ